MVEMGKECGFPFNFDILRPFTRCKTELQSKMELQPIKSPNDLLYPRVEVCRATNSLWGTRLRTQTQSMDVASDQCWH